MIQSITCDLTEFSSLFKWFDMLRYLEWFAIPEPWTYKVPQLEKKNQVNPILENYIFHTFKRLACEYNNAKDVSEAKLRIYIDDKYACFNTGLFTRNYKYIYAFFERNKIAYDARQWWLKGFYDDSSPNLEPIYPLPERAKYINDITELIYDTKLDLRINVAHILDNPRNRERIPQSVRDLPNLSVLFDGAISLAKKKIEANYKVAIPQYYQDQMQFLIPISLMDLEKVDIALAVAKKNGYYTGNTCLTIDMAYNNARLITRPDSDWLTP